MRKIIGVNLWLVALTLGMFFFGRNWLRLKPDLGVKLAPPTNLTAQCGDNFVTLFWEKGLAEAEYHLYQAERAKGPFRLIGVTRENSYTVTGLAKNISYFFAITASLNQVAESDYSGVVKVRLEKQDEN